MKRVMKKMVCVLVAAAMVLALIGCGSSSKNNDKEKFLGTWKVDVDLTDAFNDGFTEGMDQIDAAASEYFNVDKFDFTVIFTFNDDGTYSMGVDDDSFNSSVDGVKESVKAGLTRYFEDMIVEMGLDMSVDEVLEASGMSMEALIDASLTPDMFGGVLEELNLSGKWKVENGKLYLTESADDDFDEEDFDYYEITEEGIKLYIPEGVEDETGLYPMLLTKVG